MTPQHKYILNIGLNKPSFVPAKLVKTLKKYPNDYRKRLSELKAMKMARPIGYDGQFRVWEITKVGKDAISN